MIVPAEVRVAYSRQRCAALTAAIEVADDGVCVTDRHGHVRYQNATFRRLLAAEAERQALDEAIADARRATVVRADARSRSPDGASAASTVVETAGTECREALTPALTLQVRTSGMEYRVRGTAVRCQDGDEDMVVVWVRRCRPQHLTPQALRERYGLTSREVRVASLVAARSGSQEIAEALGISPHTARRHAEAVLRKLGVHSRADVRERLRG